MSENLRMLFRVVLLAATMAVLFASATLSADMKALRKRAEAGDARAQFDIGSMYERGLGVRQDYGEAARWYRRAAEQGDVDAQRILGVAYYMWEHVPRDLVQSYFWFSLAASRLSGGEYRQAAEARARIEKELTPEQLKRAQAMERDREKSRPRR